MPNPIPDRASLALESGARVLLALLAYFYFADLPAAAGIDLSTAMVALVAYLVLQGALLSQALFARPAAWLVPSTVLLDAVFAAGALASDPAPLPPTLLLVMAMALNPGLRGVVAAAAALALAAVAIGAGLWLRETLYAHHLVATLGHALAFVFAALAYVALQSWRHSVQQARAAQFADQDLETQLLNRRGFDSAARYLVPLHQRTQLPLVIMLASLDTRDAQPLEPRVLAKAVRQVGHVVRQRARRSDVVARLSPDEFVFMMFDTPLAGSEKLARALLERFEEWRLREGLDVRLTFGMVNTPDDPVAIDQLVARARSSVQRAQKHPSSPAVVTAPSL